MAAEIRRSSKKTGLRPALKLSLSAFNNWRGDFAPSMGAALAYYTVFSLAPLLVVTIAVAALVFGQDAAQAAVFEQARTLVGDNGAKAIESILTNARKPREGALASIVGIIALIFGATTVFAEIETNLNRIWKVPAPKHSGLWNFVRTRLLSFGLVLAVGFLLLVSLVVSAGIAMLSGVWSQWFGTWKTVLHVVNFVVPIAIITILFALIYKFLPNVTIRWRDVWTGALVTSLLFSLGRFLIAQYLGRAGVESSYGAAGAFVVLLVWVYYSAQIFLLGAEFTKVFSQPPSRVDEKRLRRPDTSKPPARRGRVT
jgi:membrane protein